MACKTDGRPAFVLWLALAASALAAPVPSSQRAATAPAAPVPSTQSAVTAPAAPVRSTQSAAVAGSQSAAKAAASAPQHLRVGDVRIEGKVYSPQALFIVSRPVDRFDHAVVPRYLQLDASASLLPYRLRPEILNTHRAALEGTSPAPLPEESPRRLP